MTETTETRNEWKETVRDIFDHAHFRGDNSGFARQIIALIEKRHHDYFCGGKTMKEWNDGV